MNAINKEYKRLTKKGGYTKELDLTQELGYSHIYNRLAELEDKIEQGELVENKVVTYINMARSGNKTLVYKALKYDELKTKIENGILVELPKKSDRVNVFAEEFEELIRKETAKEIVDRLMKYESYFDDYKFDRILDDISIDYGIEVEE